MQRPPLRRPSLVAYADRPLARGIATPASTGLAPDKGGGVSYLPEAEALFSAFTTPADAPRKSLINETIVALKSSGWWDVSNRIRFLAAHDSQAARLDWKTAANPVSLFNSPGFVADEGFSGDGLSSYMLDPFSPASVGSHFTVNSNSMFVWMRSMGPIGSTVILMGNNNSRIGRSSSGPQLARNANVSYDNSGDNDMTGKLVGNMRTNSAGYGIFKGAVIASSPVRASAALDGTTFGLLATEMGGAPSSGQMAFSIIAGGRPSASVADLQDIVASWLAQL